MRAEVISIGSELASGFSLDTNSRWISQRLAEVGIEVHYHTTVVDEMDANVDVLRAATERAELVVVTGGLGPTQDDLTREALAKVAGVELVFDQPSLDHIEAIFRMFQRPMPERNRVQAYVPAGATIIPNQNGTAPGIWMEVGKSIVVCMPGVPREMFSMFQDWVLPRVLERFAISKATVHRTLRCFGAGESQIEEMLGDMTKRGRHPQVGITASEATISLRITATAETPAKAREMIEPDARYIHQILGKLVFGEDDETLQEAVGKLLIKHSTRLATAESCTGGMLGAMLTDVPGISQCYLGGIVSYSNQAKIDHLGVSGKLLTAHGAVSEEVAVAMAKGCMKRFHSDLAVSITGVAGPGGGSPTKPVGLVYVALAHPDGVKVRNFQWGPDRKSVRIRSAKMALNLLRLYLLGAGEE